MDEFYTITACGESCVNCEKKLNGKCPGCIEADGVVPEWKESGRCKIHACARENNCRFCAMCPKFPCENMEKLIHWNPDIKERMMELRRKYE